MSVGDRVGVDVRLSEGVIDSQRSAALRQDPACRNGRDCEHQLCRGVVHIGNQQLGIADRRGGSTLGHGQTDVCRQSRRVVDRGHRDAERGLADRATRPIADRKLKAVAGRLAAVVNVGDQPAVDISLSERVAGIQGRAALLQCAVDRGRINRINQAGRTLFGIGHLQFDSRDRGRRTFIEGQARVRRHGRCRVGRRQCDVERRGTNGTTRAVADGEGKAICRTRGRGRVSDQATINVGLRERISRIQSRATLLKQSRRRRAHRIGELCGRVVDVADLQNRGGDGGRTAQHDPRQAGVRGQCRSIVDRGHRDIKGRRPDRTPRTVSDREREAVAGGLTAVVDVGDQIVIDIILRERTARIQGRAALLKGAVDRGRANRVRHAGRSLFRISGLQFRGRYGPRRTFVYSQAGIRSHHWRLIGRARREGYAAESEVGTGGRQRCEVACCTSQSAAEAGRVRNLDE